MIISDENFKGFVMFALIWLVLVRVVEAIMKAIVMRKLK